MRSTILILALGTAVSACSTTATDNGARTTGLAAVHVPVVTRTDYVFDAQAPGGSLMPSEMSRLDAWFRTMDMRYGDSVYVAQPASAEARRQVQAVAGEYGILLSNGSPATVGNPGYDSVRVVVSRSQASVPGCPDWDQVSQPNYRNESLANFGCGVNSALAAQVANPQDLISGHADASASDGETAAKAINLYRGWALTAVSEGQGSRPLQKADTTQGGK